MRNKKLIPIIGLLLLVAAALAFGASQTPAVSHPDGTIVESPNARAATSQPVVVPDAPGLPAATGQVAFEDAFSKSGLSNWQNLASAAGTWAVADGRLKQYGSAEEAGYYTDDPAVLLVKGIIFGDGALEAYVYPQKGTPAGLVFRGSDAGYYRLSLYRNAANQTPKAYLEKVTAGGVQTIAEVPTGAWAGFTKAAWQLVSVSTNGSHISVSVNGAKILEATDASYSSGWAGVWSTSDAGAQFDNVRIQRPAGQ